MKYRNGLGKLSFSSKGLSKYLEQTHPTADSYGYFKGLFSEVKCLVKVSPVGIRNGYLFKKKKNGI